MTDRKKPGVALWASVALVVVLVGYPLSFGPVCWMNSRNGFGDRLLRGFFHPILRLGSDTKNQSTAIVLWFAGLGATDGLKPEIWRPDPDGMSGVFLRRLTPWPGYVASPSHNYRIAWREVP